MTEAQPYQYRAFISYRHQSPDQEIARKLHTMIETFGIPKALQKSQGISSMGRVFRDQEELPLSSDLGADIHCALEGSEWLICICSPRYLQSRWCMEELRYFISLGRRDHVLAVLVEDEPVNSFPEQLRFYEKDGARIEQEPLAADVRSDSIEGSLKKLKNEKLRIIAPMLGVRYDDLKQRARQRRYRIMAAAAMAVILLLSGFLGYAIFKNNQITAEKNAALISQSKFLASQADELINTSGDRMLAVLLACEALPEDFDDPDRPVTAEAIYALRTALVSGMSSQYVTVTDFDISIRDSRGSDNTLTIISDDLDGYMGLFDLSSGKQLSSWHLDKRPYKTAISNDLSTIYCTDSSGFHRISESNGQSEDILLYSYTYFDEFSTPISASEDCTSCVFSDGGHMLVTGT
ncbi:MAG: toll/interleukin-1 receptor domain-containing protein, partial [Erysipelotrichaceae bacterium]|nr:toll/interleukin-1 receptor domain-containing protein [Erysipelotrichaceae bacterium]